MHNFQTRENFQYDLEIQTSTVISDSTGIFCLILNLKYMLGGSCYADYTPTPNVPYGNILKQPNEAGSGAEFIPFYYELPVYGFITHPPNQANHLLGPIDGTICDSLGLDDETGIQKIEQFSVNMYPNPGSNQLNFSTDLSLPIKVVIRDNQGKLVYGNNFNTHKFSIGKDLNALKSGIYFVEIQSEKSGYRLSRKWMKLE